MWDAEDGNWLAHHLVGTERIGILDMISTGPVSIKDLEWSQSQVGRWLTTWQRKIIVASLAIYTYVLAPRLFCVFSVDVPS